MKEVSQKDLSALKASPLSDIGLAQAKKVLDKEAEATAMKDKIADGMSYQINDNTSAMSCIWFSAYIVNKRQKEVSVPVRITWFKDANVTRVVISTFPLLPINSLAALRGHTFIGESLQHDGDKHDPVIALYFAIQRALQRNGSKSDHFKHMLYKSCKVMLLVLQDRLNRSMEA